ncbi:Cobyrinic acid ac-diamide synthase [Methanocaldococcus villosus KIN24-T80]|uniref:Cobyrinic acid ac-diamide synthase n=1 Tax=Methanocaldococcus villosus KIN24-T80 TaxID=1069083 RepID=N6VQ67_9EURY|nr:MinD/ParA family protein [Methanocaldococcus villosus]ENN96025.1 Cobyrinic acid ac-diamide synthase [Methanocaldococcus villosus KIN24-T80]
MKVVTFAIAKGGTGKTIITANVSAALGKKGKRVLIIDNDIGSRSLSYLFNISPERYLIDIINKKSIKDAIIKTDVENIDILPMGKNLMDYLKLDIEDLNKFNEIKDYDYIFIDSPATSTGVETYISLGFSNYFIPVIDYTSLAPSLQGAINTLVIGKNYLESEPVGFIINKAEEVPESVKKDLEKILGVKCIAIINKNSFIEDSYEKKKILYLTGEDERFNKIIDNIVNFLEELEDKSEINIPSVIAKIKKATLF